MTEAAKIKYEDAEAEVARIAERLEKGEFELDTMVVDVKRAYELTSMCQTRLRDIEADIEAIIKANSKPQQ